MRPLDIGATLTGLCSGSGPAFAGAHHFPRVRLLPLPEARHVKLCGPEPPSLPRFRDRPRRSRLETATLCPVGERRSVPFPIIVPEHRLAPEARDCSVDAVSLRVGSDDKRRSRLRGARHPSPNRRKDRSHPGPERPALGWLAPPAGTGPLHSASRRSSPPAGTLLRGTGAEARGPGGNSHTGKRLASLRRVGTPPGPSGFHRSGGGGLTVPLQRGPGP